MGLVIDLVIDYVVYGCIISCIDVVVIGEDGIVDGIYGGVDGCVFVVGVYVVVVGYGGQCDGSDGNGSDFVKCFYDFFLIVNKDLFLKFFE